MYVQTKLLEQAREVYTAVFVQGGSVAIAGSAKRMPADVVGALQQVHDLAARWGGGCGVYCAACLLHPFSGLLGKGPAPSRPRGKCRTARCNHLFRSPLLAQIAAAVGRMGDAAAAEAVATLVQQGRIAIEAWS